MATKETTTGSLEGLRASSHHVFQNGRWTASVGHTIDENFVSVFVNGQELVTMMATPQRQIELAVGYLYNEGLIAGADDILNAGLAPNQSCVDVWLRQRHLTLPERRVLTSGCGQGTTFDRVASLPPLDSDVHLRPQELAGLMRSLQERAELYLQARGIHAAGLATTQELVMVAEDVGRHNTLDKLAGWCLLNGIDPHDHLLLTTGRISSEMTAKARRMGVPLIASLTSPTSLSVQRADAWRMTLVGYLRGERMLVYTHPQRLQPAGDGQSPIGA